MPSNHPADNFEQRFDARYSDGTSARSHDVGVRLSSTGLQIIEPGSSTPVLWPYDKLSVAEPIRKASVDTLVTCSDIEDATVFVPGATFSNALAKRAPHLAVHNERWRNTRPWLAAAAAFAALVAIIYIADLSPARYFATLLPETLRDNLGRKSIEGLVDGRGICTGKDGQEALNALMDRLSKASGSDVRITATVADWELLNAFTAPGAHIVVTRRLINSAKTPDEVAGVLAHEVGHAIELHPETALVRVVGLSLMIELITGGSGSTAASLGLVIAQLSYTRSAEREADDHALAILKKAKISPKGLERFFERISSYDPDKPKKKNKGKKESGDDAKTDKKKDQKKDEKTDKKSASRPDASNKTNAKQKTASKDEVEDFISGGLFDILRTHPHTKERLDHIRRQPHYDAKPAMNASEWTALRAICSTTRDKKTKKPFWTFGQ